MNFNIPFIVFNIVWIAAGFPVAPRAYSQNPLASGNMGGAGSEASSPTGVAPKAMVVLQAKLRVRLDTLEERARRIVGQQINDGRFLLYVKADVSSEKFLAFVKTNNSSTRLTTLPVTIGGTEKQKLIADGLSSDEVALLAGPLSVTITFDNEIPDVQINALKDAVVDALEISGRKGDTVTVRKAPLTPQSTSTKLEKLNIKISESSKDIDKLRYEISTANQRVAQVEAERTKLQTDLRGAQEKLENTERLLSEEKDKNRRMEEDLSIYKTPMGEIKKLLKGLELPLTVLPVALLLFVFAAVGFFIYMRFQGAKTSKFMQAAEVMAQALAKAGRSTGGNTMTLDAARAEMTRLMAHQNDESARHAPVGAAQALLSGEELASAQREVHDVWASLKKYPYLTRSELREWLEAGGPQTQKFIALTHALGPVESMQLLQQFSHENLLQLRRDGLDNTSKLPGYAAILQLHRSVMADVLRKPACVAEFDFPQLVRANDVQLAKVLSNSKPINIALCVSLLPQTRCTRIMESLPAATQELCVEGMAAVAQLEGAKLEQQLRLFKEELSAPLTDTSTTRLGVEDAMNVLLQESSTKTKAVLQKSLANHSEFKRTLQKEWVTFEDVLALDNETLNELLDDVEPEDLAILVTGLPNNVRNRLAQFLPRNIVVAIQNELKRISARPTLLRRAQTQSLELQAALTDRLKALIKDGAIEPPAKAANGEKQFGSIGTGNETEKSSEKSNTSATDLAKTAVLLLGLAIPASDAHAAANHQLTLSSNAGQWNTSLGSETVNTRSLLGSVVNYSYLSGFSKAFFINYGALMSKQTILMQGLTAGLDYAVWGGQNLLLTSSRNASYSFDFPLRVGLFFAGTGRSYDVSEFKPPNVVSFQKRVPEKSSFLGVVGGVSLDWPLNERTSAVARVAVVAPWFVNQPGQKGSLFEGGFGLGLLL